MVFLVLCCWMLYDVVMFLKEMAITPTTCRNSKIFGVMFPFGTSSAWSKAQRAEWIQMAALSISRGRHIGYTCLSGFFPRFAKKQLLFCSPSDCLFLVGCLSPQEGNLEPYND